MTMAKATIEKNKHNTFPGKNRNLFNKSHRKSMKILHIKDGVFHFTRIPLNADDIRFSMDDILMIPTSNTPLRCGKMNAAYLDIFSAFFHTSSCNAIGH